MEAERQTEDRFDELRRRAAAILSGRDDAADPRLADDLSRLVEELRISTVELELQNDELRATQQRLEQARAEFFRLYEFAPVGFVTLGGNGGIQRLNQTARRWLLDKNELGPQNLFYRFVAAAHRGRFLAFLRDVALSTEALSVDVQLDPTNAAEPRWVALTGVTLPGPRDAAQTDRVLLTVTDISEFKRTQRFLRESEAHYRTIFETVSQGVVILDAAGRVVDANPAACKLLRSPRRLLLGLALPLDGEQPGADTIRAIHEAIAAEGTYLGRHQIHPFDGEPCPVQVVCAPYSRDGRTQTLAVIRDITDQLRAEEQLRESAIVFEQSHEGIMMTDREHRILMVNRAGCELTGYQREDLIGQKPSVLDSGRHGPEFFAGVVRALRREGTWQGEIWNRKRSGEVYVQWTSVNAVRDDAGEIVRHIIIFHDITEQKQAESRIRELAHYDQLTGLANRALFQDRLEHALAHARRHDEWLGVVFLDLDNFKGVNDSLGHMAGDALLQEVARRLQGCIRGEDTVARLGGDEFALILAGLPSRDVAQRIAARVATGCLEALAEPVAIEDRQVFSGASIGVALFPQDGDDPDALLRAADSAMYAAKERGKNTFHLYGEQMSRQALQRLDLETALRQALHRREFCLEYLPRWDAASLALRGLTARVRWCSAEGRPVPQHEFLALAEETGLAREIGDWTLEQLCRQGRRWLDEGLEFGRLALPLSVRQFRDGDVPARVREMLADAGLQPEHLDLEVAEATLTSHLEDTVAALAELRDLGVTVTIDDFGAGYSSLGLLKQLPVDRLKLDCSMLREVTTSAEDRAVVELVTGMARVLGLEVVAPGIASDAQAAVLRDLGCHELQGPWLGPALPAPDVVEVLGRRG